MGNKARLFCASGLTLLFAGPALCQEPSATANTSTESARASEQVADAQQTIDLLTAPIKSQVELETYLQRTPVAASPLRYLSSEARERFLSSVVINKTGLVGFDYTALQGLSPTHAYQILSLFGLQRTVPMIEGLHSDTQVDNLIMVNTIAPKTSCELGKRVDNEHDRCVFAVAICCSI